MAGVNKDLIKLALAKTSGQKVAFVPSDGAANAGAPPAAPGGDPMAGGAPPAPPPAPGGDPGVGAGMPPPPPAPGGGGDPTGGLAGGMVDAKIQNAVQQAIQAGGGGAAGAGGAGKPPKPDINMVATDVFQLKKMLFSIFKQMGIEMPDNLLDGPGRHPGTGHPVAPAAGGSDPNAGPPPGAQGPAGAIQPIQPIQPAMGGMKQAAHVTDAELLKEAGDLLHLWAALKAHRGGAGRVEKEASVAVGQPFGKASAPRSATSAAAAVVSMFRARRPA